MTGFYITSSPHSSFWLLGEVRVPRTDWSSVLISFSGSRCSLWRWATADLFSCRLVCFLSMCFFKFRLFITIWQMGQLMCSTGFTLCTCLLGVVETRLVVIRAEVGIAEGVFGSIWAEAEGAELVSDAARGGGALTLCFCLHNPRCLMKSDLRERVDWQ